MKWKKGKYLILSSLNSQYIILKEDLSIFFTFYFAKEQPYLFSRFYGWNTETCLIWDRLNKFCITVLNSSGLEQQKRAAAESVEQKKSHLIEQRELLRALGYNSFNSENTVLKDILISRDFLQRHDPSLMIQD